MMMYSLRHTTARMFCVPHLYENFGETILETTGAGLMCIATRTGAVNLHLGT